MRLALVLVGLCCALGCAHGVTTTKVGDDTFRIQCSELGLDRCLAEAATNACDKRAYFVARGISDVNFRGRTDAPDVVLSSEAIVRCAPTNRGWGDQGKELMSGAGSAAVTAPPAAAAVASAPSAAPAVAPKAPICAPGSTQACIGTAACPGGQACKADGSGYEPCDCGPAASPSPAAPPSSGSATP